MASLLFVSGIVLPVHAVIILYGSNSLWIGVLVSILVLQPLSQFRSRGGGVDPSVFNEGCIEEFVAINKQMNKKQKNCHTYKSLSLAFPLLQGIGLVQYGKKKNPYQPYLPQGQFLHGSPKKYKLLSLDFEMINSDWPYTPLLLVLQIAFGKLFYLSGTQMPNLN